MKIMTSPAYNISDRSSGYSLRVGLNNNYMQPDSVNDVGDLSFRAEYAMPMGMDKQINAYFTYNQNLSGDDSAFATGEMATDDYDDEYEKHILGGNSSMALGLSYSMDHSYSWSTNASFIYASSTFTDVMPYQGDFVSPDDYSDNPEATSKSTITLGMSTTKAMLNKFSVTGGFGYVMDLEDDGEDPIMDLDVMFTYWVF